MTVAYIMEQNSTVAKEGDRILIKKNKTVIHTLHAFKINQIVIFGNVFITPQAVSHLFASAIDTVFMTKNGRFRGRLQGPLSKNIILRQRQFMKMADPDFRLQTAGFIVKGKLKNLRTALLRLNRSRDAFNLEPQILGIRGLSQKVEEAPDLDALRGLEGKGSAFYFEGFARGFLKEGIAFSKRVRRPPTDPVNALLSLGYAFLFNELMGVVNMIGLDPYLGTLHELEYGRPSLPLDLMEEWRPVIVDSLVLSLFNLKTMTTEDFTILSSSEEYKEEIEEHEVTQSGIYPVRLTEDGMKKFISQYERKMAQKIQYSPTGRHFTYRDCIREQVRHFARYLREEEEEYRPINLK